MLVLVLHGLGATNTDLVGVLPSLASFEPVIAGARIVEVYPQAPEVPMLGTAWWKFNVMDYMKAVMMRDDALMARVIREPPEGIAECRTRMTTLLAEARALASGGEAAAAADAAPALLPWGKVLLAGFSLGAITAIDTAIMRPAGEDVAGVLAMNGAPICVEEWAKGLAAHKGSRFFLTAGQQDTTLPASAMQWVKDLLVANGAQAELKLHPGGHEVGGPDVVRAIAVFVRQMCEAASKL